MELYDSRYFVINKKLQKLIGVWPFESRTRKNFCRTFGFIFMFIGVIPQVIALDVARRNKDFDKITQSFATFLFVLAIYSKLVTSIMKEEQMIKLYEEIVNNWNQMKEKDDKKEMIKHAEIGRFMTICYAAYVFNALIGFITFPLLPSIMDKISPLANGSRPRIYVLEGQYMVDREQYFGIIYILEAGVCIMMVVIFCTCDTAFCVCVEQSVGLMSVVKMRLKKATKYGSQWEKTDPNNTPYALVKKLIVFHQKVLTSVEIVESAYSFYLFALMGFNVFILSCGSLVIVANLDNPMETLRYGMIFIGLMIHMFFLNLPGQRLLDASSDLHCNAYDNEWYECSEQTKQLLLFIMLKCKTPCIITAGKIVIMNIQNFGILAKSAASYFTVFASFR
ncbi:uncharacterized protein LOC106649334 isoform X1 [Trichogramma pretiosum]|uniref:uncharacterized protein LOC106649334 isoform X1 n=1 Tax=Trichogramma pretiosum TaxID=7493 RepID=UPI0006C93DE1|nr:uncharacterized protein LOC106649334 isoform X1 [Trichogramma pretiosum]